MINTAAVEKCHIESPVKVSAEYGGRLNDLSGRESIDLPMNQFLEMTKKFGSVSCSYSLQLLLPISAPQSFFATCPFDGSTDSDLCVTHISNDYVLSGWSVDPDERRRKAPYQGWRCEFYAERGARVRVAAKFKEAMFSIENIVANEVYLIGLSQVLHNAVYKSILKEGRVGTMCRLTARETEVLKWAADGKTSNEVSMILGISKRTVETHIARSMSKLNACTRSSAVLRAHALGVF